MIQFITHRNTCLSDVEIARLALSGGCRWVQLRMKEASEELLRTTAIELIALCRTYGATCIIDDHIQLAMELGADGVHLGKNDMPMAEARALAPLGFLIGGTANTLEDMVALALAGADYIGLGPYKFTTTKKNLSAILGLEGYRDRMRGFREAGFEIPVVAIGGIEPEDIPLLMDTGVSGIALSGTILNASDPVAMTRQLINLTI